MRFNLALLIFIISFCSLAEDGTNLLLKNSKEEVQLGQQLVKRPTLNLDNPFKVQLFSVWKASQSNNKNFDQWVELILADKNKKALVNYPVILDQVNAHLKTIAKSSLVYLLYKNKLYQNFLNHWLALAYQGNFLQTQLGLSIDHILAKDAVKLIQEQGFVLTQTQLKQLKSIEGVESQFNYQLQAWTNRNNGLNAMKWVNKLDEDNPFRLKIIYSAVLEYAQDGKLAASGQLIKKGVEPFIANSNDLETISQYYITLARLLYQADAFDAAKYYYNLIPEKSKYFIQANIEKSWSLIQLNELAQAKGLLTSLKFEAFHDRFLPDAYLTSAIVNLKTCQFVEVQKDLNSFVKVNQKWAKMIDQNKNNTDKDYLFKNNITDSLDLNQSSIKTQRKLISQIFPNQLQKNNEIGLFTEFLNSQLTEVDRANKIKQNKTARLQWDNREKILEDSIYRFKFVRIEFLSQMRNLALNNPLSNTDTVKTYQASSASANEITFPNDGLIWGDDLFKMTAKVKNLCLKGLTK